MASESGSIRRADISELTLLGKIERAAGELFRATTFSELADAEPLDIKWLQDQQRRGLVWIALDADGIPCGFAAVQLLAGSAHLHELAVDPRCGRRGHGTALIQTVAEFAHGQGYRFLTLSTFRDIPWNAPFYARLGFEIMTELDEDLQELRRREEQNGLPLSERVMMRLELKD